MGGWGGDKSQPRQWGLKTSTPTDNPALSLFLLPEAPSVSLPAPSVSEIPDTFCDAVFWVRGLERMGSNPGSASDQLWPQPSYCASVSLCLLTCKRRRVESVCGFQTLFEHIP